jgi:hypothetical protein
VVARSAAIEDDILFLGTEELCCRPHWAGAGENACAPERLSDVWNYVSAALTYYFEEEIATINQYSTYTLWWGDRVSTFLDRLSDWIEIWGRGTKRNPLPVLRTSLNLIMKDRIWDFAVSEIALQLGKPSNELLLPNRESLEAIFFARVAKVRAAARRKRIYSD